MVLINFLFARTVYLAVDTINPLGMAGVYSIKLFKISEWSQNSSTVYKILAL